MIEEMMTLLHTKQRGELKRFNKTDEDHKRRVAARRQEVEPSQRQSR